jgi:hypothetical protein
MAALFGAKLIKGSPTAASRFEEGSIREQLQRQQQYIFPRNPWHNQAHFI